MEQKMTPSLGEFGLERRPDGNRIENRVDGHTSERLLLVERNAELAYVASNSGSTSSSDWSGLTLFGAE